MDVEEAEARLEVEEALAIVGAEAVAVEFPEEAASAVEEEEEGVGARTRILPSREGAGHMVHRCDIWRCGGLALHCRFPAYGCLMFLKSLPCLVASHQLYEWYSTGC